MPNSKSFYPSTISPGLMCLWEMENHEIIRNGIIYASRMRVSSCCFVMAACPKACSFIEVCVQRVGENCAAFARASLLQADGEYHTTMSGQGAPAA